MKKLSLLTLIFLLSNTGKLNATNWSPLFYPSEILEDTIANSVTYFIAEMEENNNTQQLKIFYTKDSSVPRPEENVLFKDNSTLWRFIEPVETAEEISNQQNGADYFLELERISNNERIITQKNLFIREDKVIENDNLKIDMIIEGQILVQMRTSNGNSPPEKSIMGNMSYYPRALHQVLQIYKSVRKKSLVKNILKK